MANLGCNPKQCDNNIKKTINVTTSINSNNFLPRANKFGTKMIAKNKIHAVFIHFPLQIHPKV